MESRAPFGRRRYFAPLLFFGLIRAAAEQTGASAAQLTEVQVPETMPENVAKALSEQLRGEARVDVAGEFTEALRKRYPVEIKRDALDRMF